MVFAKIVGVKQSQVSEWLKGKAKPRGIIFYGSFALRLIFQPTTFWDLKKIIKI